jgi:hypothetical protein
MCLAPLETYYVESDVLRKCLARHLVPVSPIVCIGSQSWHCNSPHSVSRHYDRQKGLAHALSAYRRERKHGTKQH